MHVTSYSYLAILVYQQARPYELLQLFSHNELKPQDPFTIMSSRTPKPWPIREIRL
uniref:Uncharacterized protein n=1 Tax=Arundo donax TaxID=35708 RepID=A0A0A9FK91_ARUDO